MTARASGGHSEQWCVEGSGQRARWAADGQRKSSRRQAASRRRGSVETPRGHCAAPGTRPGPSLDVMVLAAESTSCRSSRVTSRFMSRHTPWSKVCAQSHMRERATRAVSCIGTTGDGAARTSGGQRAVVEGSEQASSGHRAGSGKAAAGRQRAGGGSADDTFSLSLRANNHSATGLTLHYILTAKNFRIVKIVRIYEETTMRAPTTVRKCYYGISDIPVPTTGLDLRCYH